MWIKCNKLFEKYLFHKLYSLIIPTEGIWHLCVRRVCVCVTAFKSFYFIFNWYSNQIQLDEVLRAFNIFFFLLLLFTYVLWYCLQTKEYSPTGIVDSKIQSKIANKQKCRIIMINPFKTNVQHTHAHVVLSYKWLGT